MTSAIQARKLHNATVTCPFCHGSGKLPHFSHVENGDCFACGATGKLRDLTAFIGNCSDVKLTVCVHSGSFHYAVLQRRTWRNVRTTIGSGKDQRIGWGKEWGRDAFTREINDAEEAREIWRNAKRLGIITELVS